MSTTIFIYGVAFLACYGLTPLVRFWSLRQGVVDVPDMARKIHRQPIPRTGGIAIALAYSIAVGALLLSPFGSAESFNMPLMVGILPAFFIVFVTGLLDDVFGLSPRVKILGQVLAATLAWYGGVEVSGFAGISAHGVWSFPLTVGWLVLCANAFNLIDGVDGLAAGLGLVAAATTLFAAILSDNLQFALAVAPLVGALLAFLRYNFNPATIFLGDCGSLSIGFLLGCYAAAWGQKTTTLMGMTAPLMALAVPLFDTGLAVSRRFLRRQPIFMSDRNHIHHRLLAQGFKPRDVAMALCGVGAVTSTFALVQSATHARYSGVVVVAFGVVAWFGVRSLGYLEFQTARYLATTGIFRHILHVQVYCRDVEAKLALAKGPDDYWQIVLGASRTFGFVSVRLEMDGKVYEHIGPGARVGSDPALQGSDPTLAPAPQGSDHALKGAAKVGSDPALQGSDPVFALAQASTSVPQLCRIQIPLGECDFVEFAHVADPLSQHAVVVSSLSDILQRALASWPARAAGNRPQAARETPRRRATDRPHKATA